MEKKELMRQMIDKLNAAADAYYNGKGELMTDYEWDALFDELKALEKETGIVLDDSPTNNVSSDNTEGQKEEHEFAALSLAKTKKPEELAKWAENRMIWLSWKLDGLTLVVTFDNGKLTKVVTRGNGHIGTNITHLASAIQGIPETIPSKGHIVIRGECVISYEDFNNFLLESDEDYANPRNLASGSLTLKDVNEVKQRHLKWIPFTLVYTDEEINSWGARMDFIEQNGMKAVEREAATAVCAADDGRIDNAGLDEPPRRREDSHAAGEAKQESQTGSQAGREQAAGNEGGKGDAPHRKRRRHRNRRRKPQEGARPDAGKPERAE